MNRFICGFLFVDVVVAVVAVVVNVVDVVNVVVSADDDTAAVVAAAAAVVVVVVVAVVGCAVDAASLLLTLDVDTVLANVVPPRAALVALLASSSRRVRPSLVFLSTATKNAPVSLCRQARRDTIAIKQTHEQRD